MTTGGTTDTAVKSSANELLDNARAKVNLTLRVVGRRVDGYHDLESVVAFADCADQLSLLPGAELALKTTGPLADACGEVGDNLVLKAARLLAERVPGLKTGVFTLHKALPVAAGIGGGVGKRLMVRLGDAALPRFAAAVPAAVAPLAVAWPHGAPALGAGSLIALVPVALAEGVPRVRLSFAVAIAFAAWIAIDGDAGLARGGGAGIAVAAAALVSFRTASDVRIAAGVFGAFGDLFCIAPVGNRIELIPNRSAACLDYVLHTVRSHRREDLQGLLGLRGASHA